MQAFAAQVKTDSGTATQWAQRAIHAHATQSGYTLCSLDIGVAFLTGLTFEEIAKETGDPLRQVQLTSPDRKMLGCCTRFQAWTTMALKWIGGPHRQPCGD